MELLTKTYQRDISCVLSCFDRLIISGTIPEISYSQGMTSYMYQNGVRIFDYAKFAEPFKETIRSNAERIAKEYGVEIEFIRKSGVRKESIISEKIKKNAVIIRVLFILSQ